LAESILSHTALRRWGGSEDLTGAYRFLASDAAAFITGTVVTVDGGYALV
jgi:NAD(P)-dependent dehydrogenase (short-subunit alcohol dehydrogenase family)